MAVGGRKEAQSPSRAKHSRAILSHVGPFMVVMVATDGGGGVGGY